MPQPRLPAFPIPFATSCYAESLFDHKHNTLNRVWKDELFPLRLTLIASQGILPRAKSGFSATQEKI
jgi:hypothetical protein